MQNLEIWLQSFRFRYAKITNIMNQKTAISIIVTVLILVTLGVYWFINQGTNPNPSVNPSTNQETSKEATNSGVQTSFSYKCQQGKSAFERLTESYPSVQTKGSSFGKMITSISGILQGNGKYWLYSVDDKEATVGAEQYICQSEEDIKWELR